MHNREEHHVLYLTRKEKKGIVVVLIVNVLILISPRIISEIFQDKIPDNTMLLNACIVLKSISKDSGIKAPSSEQQNTVFTESKSLSNLHLFYFDPNHISDDDWSKLGLKEKTIQTIKRYLSKGGRFTHPEDLKKIWGLSPSLAEKLMPYVKIKQDEKASIRKEYEQFNKKSVQKNSIININTADSIQFESLPGIGPALARRIILFRTKLGGFYSVDQISEVWGLSDTVFQKIKNRLGTGEIKINSIDINSASFEQLKSHPYIGYKIAATIVNYRNQHGYYQSLEEIQKIPIVDDKSYNKIVHYLAIKQL